MSKAVNPTNPYSRPSEQILSKLEQLHIKAADIVAMFEGLWSGAWKEPLSFSDSLKFKEIDVKDNGREAVLQDQTDYENNTFSKFALTNSSLPINTPSRIRFRIDCLSNNVSIGICSRSIVSEKDYVFRSKPYSYKQARASTTAHTR